MGDHVLIRNARIWVSAARETIENGSLLIAGGRLRKVGTFRARAETVIDAGGALALPGFIHTHVHLCQTIFRGSAEDRPLLPWLRERIWPLEAAHTPASLRASARLACAELIRGGTTAFQSLETVRFTQAAFESADEAGLCGVIGHCLMDDSGGYAPLAVGMDEALTECERILDLWEKHPRLRLGVAPRFALSCTADNLRRAAEYARRRGLRLHTHAAEQRAEVEWVREHTGYSNVDYLHRLGLSGPDVGLAHCVHLEPDEVALMARTGTHALHCPSANCKLGSGTAPVPELLAAGVSVSLGADGAACNNRLDMFAEMRLAGHLQALRKGPGALPAREILRLATEGGAKALGWEDEMGTLEEGKRANLILVELDNLHVLPSPDPAAAVVYGAGPDAVALTMVDGRVLYENGTLTTLDEAALKAEVAVERRKLFARAGLEPAHSGS